MVHDCPCEGNRLGSSPSTKESAKFLLSTAQMSYEEDPIQYLKSDPTLARRVISRAQERAKFDRINNGSFLLQDDVDAAIKVLKEEGILPKPVSNRGFVG